MSASFDSFVHVLQRRASDEPGRRVFTYLNDGERDEIPVTFGELDAKARAVAAMLQASAEPGARIVLLYPPGIDYVAAFFGCLYGGFVAVPAYPPDPSRLARTLPRLHAIIADARAEIVLTTSMIASMTEMLAATAPELAKLRWVATDIIDAALASEWRPVAPTSETLAFLQYTSGSTGTPKGVMLTHGNLIANERAIQSVFKLSRDESVGVGWLPLYHDMGLIGNVLQTVFVGFHCVLMSPLDFLQRPLRWLDAISRFGGTVSGGPNFAYELCVRKITPEERAKLDLRRWRLAFSGAEPVRRASLDRFAETFGECGFRRDSFLPCYGLAEATLLVCGKPMGTDYRIEHVDAKALEEGRAEIAAETGAGASREIVSCGIVPSETHVVVVDPETRRPRPDGVVGELWVAGPHVAIGYWGDARKTAEVFGAELAAGREEGRPKTTWLRTGDLAFLHDGEVFVCGRSKDLVIVRGKNYFPQDIERAAEAGSRSIRQGGVAAFGVTIDGEERVVVVAELVRAEGVDADAVFDAVRRGVVEDASLHLHAVVLVRPGSIPKTSSGKIQRHAAKAAFLEGSLDAVASSPTKSRLASADVADEAATEAEAVPDEAPIGLADLEVAAAASRRAVLERFLRNEIARVLRTAPAKVDLSTSIGSLGLDSLMAVDVAHAVERSFGVVLPVTALLRPGTGHALVDNIAKLVGAPAKAAPVEDSVPARATFPLSAGQEALWFLQGLTGETSAYNVGTAFAVDGALDVDVLANALRLLLERNDALTASFEHGPDGLVQTTDPALAQRFDVARIDATGLDDAAVHRLVGDEVYRPFELERGPMFRAAVIARGPGANVLVLAAHHIAADLWSLVVVLSELRTVYAALRAGEPVPLLPARAPYRAFVAWQRAYLEREAETDWAYWRKQIEGVPALELPTDHPRPSVQTYAGAAAPIELDPELVARAAELARREGTTLFVVLLAAFEILLARTTGQTRFLVGSPVAGRPRASFERTLGYFVNPVPLRADLGGEPTGRELLARVRETVLDGLEHQSFPFVRAVDRSGVARDPSRSPLFQALFVLEKAYIDEASDLTMLALGASATRAEFAGLGLGPFPVGKRTERFDVTLSLAQSEGRVAGALEYNSDLFDAATAARMAKQLVTLLGALVATPNERVLGLPMMGPAERASLLAMSRGPAPVDAPRATVHTLFEEVAARSPNALAVVGDGEALSYAELDRRASALAAHLREAHGVGPEVRVVTCFERSPGMVVADLAVLKAGGAFVPVDPSHPRARIEHVTDDAGAIVVLTSRALAPRLGSSVGRATVVVVDDATLARGGTPVVTAPSNDRSSAYVVYTSGTTGRPKGVVIEHAQLVAMARWVMRYYALGASDRLSQTAGAAFDASVFEIVPPLLAGASLHFVDDDTRRAPEALRAFVLEHAITICFAPTPLAEQLLVEKDWEGTALRYLQSGGDRLTRRPEAHHPFVLINGYGPSECTVQSTVAAVGRADGAKRAPTIGTPIDGVSVYVLDERLEPLPVGLVGELFVGGRSVGRGYGGRPALTAERFLPDPFAAVPGARMYRTGDLGRFLASGEIEFVGRVDHQVKIHGHRIELGEIESALGKDATVRDAVVLAREDVPGRKRLVAYVTERDVASPPEPSALAARLRAELPEYMVPSAIVVLDSLPLTQNGKVDRAALPAPATSTSESNGGAGDELEARLAQIAADVLEVPLIAVGDRFFEAGASSLDLAKLRKRIETDLGVRLPLPAFFEYPSIAALAPRVRSMMIEKERALGVVAPSPRATDVRTPARRDGSMAVAIVGMAGRFPGAANVAELWENVVNARDCLDRFEPSRARRSPLVPEGPSHPSFLGVEGVLAATGTDPELWRPSADTRGLVLQSRLFLDSVLAAFEDAGHDPWSYQGRVAVYGGASPLPFVEALAEQGLAARGSALWALGTVAPDTLPMRAAHTFGFRGEAMNVNTACSTGLAVVHLACKSLLEGECDLAVAVAANVPTTQRIGYVWEEGTILSKDGVVRPFDADASGVVLGRGVAAVLLKPLDAALRDGDPVYAVIRSSATNNDGRSKVGYTAPSVEGQIEVVAAAHALAGISAGDIDYVETHGTGTRLGDPVELSALTRAFRRTTGDVGFCALGALKANIGHLDTAAGLAGLVKTALALHHEVLPPLAHFRAPNPELTLDASPFTFPTEAKPWRRGARARRAGVSSFGIGGTNVHVVLEEAPARPASSAPRRRHVLLALGARTEDALASHAVDLAKRLEGTSLAEACDVAYTVSTRRLKWAERRVVVGRDGASLSLALGVRPSAHGFRHDGIAFVFAGMGANPAGTGRELYEDEPIFRAHLDACQAALAPAGYDVRSALVERMPGERLSVGLAATALFTLETGLVRLLASWGIKPSCVVGHSFGEYAGLVAAGAVTLENALPIVAARADAMEAMPEGAMLLATIGESEARAIAGTAGVEVAALNGPRGTVFSGSPARIEALQSSLRARRVACVKLAVDRALHSVDVDAVLPRIATAFEAATIAAPKVRFVSTVTGKPEEARLASASYWTDQMRHAVRFDEALRATAASTFVEIGPSGGLVPAIAAVFGTGVAVEPTLLGHADATPLYTVLARAIEAGMPFDWAAWYEGETRNRVPAPLHPRPLAEPEAASPAMPVVAAAPAPAPVALPLVARPTPPAASPAPATTNVAAIEAVVIDLWKKALHLDAVDPRAHFLELGGSSLLAVQLVATMRDTFNVDIGLGEVFAAPTVEDIARLIATKVPQPVAAAGVDRAPIAPAPIAAAPSFAAPTTPAVPGAPSAVQLRVMAADADPAWPASVVNMGGAVRLRGRLDVAALARALRDVVKRHDALHTRIVRAGETLLLSPRYRASDVSLAAVWCESEGTDARLAEVRAAMLERIEHPLDVERENPMRAFLFHVGDDDHVLGLVVHHLSMDAPSLKVLLQDTLAAYLGVSQGVGPSYVEFAARQAAEIASPAGARHLAWHRSQIESSARLRGLVADGGARADTTATFELGPAIGRAVAELQKQRGVSTFVAVASAIALAFGDVLGTREVVLATPYGNRERAEHAPLVGYVAHCMVMPLDLERGRSAEGGVLGEVSRAFGDALLHASVPFETAVLERADVRRAAPFSDVCLVVHEELEQSVRLGELLVDPFPYESADASQPPVWASTMGTIGFLVHVRPGDASWRVTFCYPRGLFADAATEVPRRVLGALEALGATSPSATTAGVDRLALPAAAPRAPLALRLDGVLLSRTELEAAVDHVHAALVAWPLPARATVDVAVDNRAALVVCALAVLRAGGKVTVGRSDTSFVLTTDGATRADGSRRVLRVDAPSSVGARGRTARFDADAAPIGDDAVAAAAARLGAERVHLVWDESLADNRALPFAIATARAGGLVSELAVVAPTARVSTGTLPLSLAYFPVDDERYDESTYRLLLEGAKVGDDAGLRGLFVPERHFHPFGGTFPDPLVAVAALASSTKRIQLRAGSIVLPLHDSVRVAESWAMADVLSGGRVGLSIATGWRAEDFVLAPSRYARRKEELLGELETLRALWRGESTERIDPNGRALRIRTRPRPIQPEIPVWLTCASSPASFALAGELGTAVFTMLSTDIGVLRENIAAYRRSFAEHWGGAMGHVTVLASTYLDEDAARARELAMPALERYMGFSLDIGLKESTTQMPDDAKRRFLRQKAERVADDHGLVGDLAEARRRLERLAEAGADEVACLVDFGIAHDEALRGIGRIGDLATKAQALSAKWTRLPVATPLEHRGLREVWLVGRTAAEGVAPAPHRELLVEDADLPATTAAFVDEQPISAIQFGVYFDDLRFARATYNNPFIVHSQAALDPEKLERALAVAAQRHDMLRSRFVAVADRIVRVVDMEPLVDLRIDADPLDEAAVLDRARRDSQERFDLGRRHPLRAHLYGAADGGSYVMLCVHHIAGDVVSGFLALRDVMRAYGSLPGDAFANVARPPSYADVLAAREVKAGDRPERLARWVDRVRGVSSIVEWPSSTPRPPRLSGEGAELSRVFPKAKLAALRTAAARSRVTVPTFLFTVLQALLHTKTRRRDLLVGCVTLGRSDPAWLEVVGPFFNMLPVRSTVEPGLAFDELARRTSTILVEAMTEEEIGVAEIVREAKTPTSLDRSPLVQFLFNYIPKAGVGDGADAGIRQVDVDWGVATFDVDVTARERGDDLLLSVKYSKDALDANDADGFLAAFEALLDGVIEKPTLKLLSDDAPSAATIAVTLPETRRVALPTDEGDAPASGARDRGDAAARVTIRASFDEVARVEGLRPEAVVLATVATFLQRHSGQNELVLATWTPRGPLDRIVGVPGAFTPVRVAIDPTAPLVDLARSVEAELAVAEAAAPMTAAAIFGAGIVGVGVGVAVGWVGEGGAADAALPPGVGLAFVVEGESLTMAFDPAMFSASTIDRFGERLRTLVGAVVHDPTMPVARIDVLPAAEREQLRAWNRTALEVPRDVWTCDLVARRARALPDAVAVVDEHGATTYGALDARAERLAGRLVEAGVKPDARVAVALPRSCAMVVALLGIQKSGAAYVPIDVSLPRERVRAMLEDAKVTHVVTDGAGTTVLPDTGAAVVRGDVDEAPTTTWVAPPRRPDATAYVIFTSGSTGRPKGVAVPHGALVNFLVSMQREPGLGPDDVLCAVTTLSFDISGLELYLPLVSGARVVVATREAAQDGKALLELCRAEGVTVLQATPTTYRLLVAAGWNGGPQWKALVGGEAVPADLVADLVPRCGSVWNMYGPTETTIWSTCARLDGGARVVVGKPIANTQVFVLGPSGERLPIGVKGELAIGGHGLAVGYVGQPGLTSERFVPSAFGDETSERLYRTGDIARILPDGDVECFGRVDSQIKLRGFRIELGEIEHVLMQNRAVKGAVVILRDDGPAGPRLVAYVVGRSRTTPLVPAEVAEAMKGALPVYMVPSVFVVLEALPLSPAGKVDRKALLAIDLGEHAPKAEYEVPTGDLETVVSAIWSEVLGVPKVGRNDNFFDLGGHSLLALQAHGKLVQRLGRDFPLLNLFSYTTVASLAAYLSGVDAKSEVVAKERDAQLERGVERLAQRRNRRRR